MTAARAETRTAVRIDWPAAVQSWSIGGSTHATCRCRKCLQASSPLDADPTDEYGSMPLCGFVPSPWSVGALGQSLTCATCIAILRDPVERVKHIESESL